MSFKGTLNCSSVSVFLYCIGLQDESECLLEYYFKIDFAQYAECN